MSLDALNLLLLGSAGVLMVAVVAVRWATRARVPTLLVFLALGLVLGEGGLGIRFNDAQLTQVLGFLALAVILTEGGLSTRWRDIRPVLGFGITLATLGVAVSVAVTASLAHLLLGVGWSYALLLGAVVSSTDAAAVFSILRRFPLRARTRSALEAEAGLNDPPVVILVVVMTSGVWQESGLWGSLAMFAYQLLGGAAVGLVVAWAGHWLLNRSALPASGLYPAATLGLGMLAFGAAGALGASGFLAAYLCGLWLGNASLPHHNAVLGFAESTAWLAQIGLFVLLGLLASPAELPGALLPALVVGTALLLLARPASVLVSAVGLGWRPLRPRWRVAPREQVFLSWAGLRGAVPIVLATIPRPDGTLAVESLFNIVFVLVVIFTVIQAPPLPWLARRLGVTQSGQAREVALDTAPFDEHQAELLHVDVCAGDGLAGRSVRDLGLPQGALVTLLVREQRGRVPSGETVLAAGDTIFIIATPAVHDELEQRLRGGSGSREA